MSKLIITLLGIYAISCTSGIAEEQTTSNQSIDTTVNTDTVVYTVPENADSPKVIHVFVALCDNYFQRIVPVPDKIGNGKDPDNNLYWGCGYGVRTFFKNSSKWTTISSAKKPKTYVLDRYVFKHKQTGAIMVADAYNGEHMDETILAFLQAGAGLTTDSVMVDSNYYYVNGGANLVAFVGHNGLLDHPLPYDAPNDRDTIKKDAIMLCCAATDNFGWYLGKAGMNPLLWTTGLMAPEAYTLHDAIETWLNDGSGEDVDKAAAEAYNKYQKCGMKGASNLFQTGY